MNHPIHTIGVRHIQDLRGFSIYSHNHLIRYQKVLKTVRDKEMKPFTFDDVFMKRGTMKPKKLLFAIGKTWS